MVEIYWRKWQLVLYKVSLCISVAIYAIWGLYFIFPGIEWTQGANPGVDQQVKEFIIFYVLASAGFITKLFESVCAVDKAGKLYVDDRDCGSIIKYNTTEEI